MTSDYIEAGRMTSAILMPDGRTTAHKIGNELKKALSALHLRAQREKEGWLHDNFYLLFREGKADRAFFRSGIRYPSSGGSPVVFELCKAYLDVAGGEVTIESTKEFWNGVKRSRLPEEKELSSLRAFLGAAIIFTLVKDGQANAEKLIGSLAVIAEEGFSRLTEKLSPIEEILSSDPIYHEMSRDTRGAYRHEVERLARKSDTKESELASSLLRRAKSDERHVGELIFPHYAKDTQLPIFYALAIAILTTFLSVMILRAGHPFLAFISWPALYEAARILCEALLSYKSDHPPLFSMAFPDGIPSEEATLAVITTVVKGKKELDEEIDRLEEHFLAERGGKNLTFGLLLDLPESRSRNDDLLTALEKAAEEGVTRLEERYHQPFAVFLRDQVYLEKEGTYAGRERKRGALMDLVTLLANGEREPFRLAHDPKGKSFRHLVTLDRDTAPYPGSITTLVAAAAHPMNRPVIRGNRVKEGYGILEPACLLSPESLEKHRFARFFGGIGGNDVYDPVIKDFYQAAFGRTPFGGKGLIDIMAASKLLLDAFQEGRILSHDTPEGGIMRAGKVGKAVFFEDFPASPRGYYKRLERWTRGDAQNLYLLFKTDSLTSFLMADNLRRALLPLSLIMTIALSMYAGAYLVEALAFMILFHPFLYEVGRLMRSGAEYAPRYLTLGLYTYQLSFRASYFRLMFLPYEAYVTFSGLIRGLVRGFITHRKALEWSLESGKGEDSTFIVLTTSVIASIFFPYLAPVWLPAFVVMKLLGKGDKKRVFSEEEEEYIRKATEDGMGFFREACKEAWGYLPADSLQIYPAEGLGLRTSPTDIGMFLLAAVSYADLALPGSEEMLNIASSALKTAERLLRKAGHLYNWYDLTTMLPAPPKVLSSVDSGNLRASLYVFSEAMREYGRDEDAERARRMADGMRFDLFYRKEKKLLAVAYDDEKGMLTENSYDLYESEARIASFLAIAHGEAETEHWKKLGRAVKTFCGAAGAASWGGTMFEYLTPYLFMSAPEGTLARESEAFAVMAEKLSGERKRLPWGVSESAFYAFDDTFHYRYKAHGSSLLATAPSRSGEYVIAPYAAFMALESEGSVDNLRRIEREGGRGKYGFFEAIDTSDDKAPRPTELYMPHHIGMQAAAAANALLDGIHRKRFMKSPNHRAFRRLLWESPRHYPEADAVLGEAPPATLGNARGARLFPEPQKRRNDRMIYDLDGKSLTLDASGVFSDPEEQLKVRLRHRDDELQLLPQKGRKGEKLETILAKDAVLFSRKEKDFTSEIRFTSGNTPHLTFILSNHAPVREEFHVTAERGGRQFASYDVSLLPGENWREERRIDG